MSNGLIYINGDNGKEYNLFPYPSWKHEDILSDLNIQFGNFFKQNCNRCKVFGSNIGLFIGNRWARLQSIESVRNTFKKQILNNKQYDVSISPDLMVICNFKAGDFDYRGYHGVPSIVVEIASPSTSVDDLTWKKDIYEAIEVKEYWVISDVENVGIFRLIDGKYELFKYQIEITQDSYPDILEVPSALFENLLIKFDNKMFKDFE